MCGVRIPQYRHGRLTDDTCPRTWGGEPPSQPAAAACSFLFARHQRFGRMYLRCRWRDRDARGRGAGTTPGTRWCRYKIGCMGYNPAPRRPITPLQPYASGGPGRPIGGHLPPPSIGRRGCPPRQRSPVVSRSLSLRDHECSPIAYRRVRASDLMSPGDRDARRPRRGLARRNEVRVVAR